MILTIPTHKPTLSEFDFSFLGSKVTGTPHRGKVRDSVTIGTDVFCTVTTDRISCFDIVLPEQIPHKGAVLNLLAAYFLEATEDICENWLEHVLHPNVSFGIKAKPIMIEMVIRGYLTGHAWREYKAGKRELCGNPLPKEMKENQKFNVPIITPTTKAQEGHHDADVSREQIIDEFRLVPEEIYDQMERYTRVLFKKGQEMARERGLILVDTKYEFGLFKGDVILIDEVHTPDSSRYWYANEYESRFEKGEPQNELSKEFARKWLMDRGFDGQTAGATPPPLTFEFITEVSERYIGLYETLTGKTFDRTISENIESDIRLAIKRKLGMRI